MAPPQISAEVPGKEGKRKGRRLLGEPVTEAVITVPAYFNDAQRQATKMPAVSQVWKSNEYHQRTDRRRTAYGLDKEVGNRTIAVYDLGGSAPSISLLSKSTKLTAKKPSKFWQPTVIPTCGVKTSTAV